MPNSHLSVRRTRRLPAAAGAPWVLALSVLALSGCSSLHLPFWHRGGKANIAACNKPQMYQESQNVAPLHVPAGLDPVNTRSALKIPELRDAQAPRQATDPCLDAPPKYSNAQLLPTNKGGVKKKRSWWSRLWHHDSDSAAPADATGKRGGGPRPEAGSGPGASPAPAPAPAPGGPATAPSGN